MADEQIETVSEEMDSETATSSTDTKTLAETGAEDTSSSEDTSSEDTSSESSGFEWPDDWRDQMAGGDEKIKSLLARYTSPAAAAKAFRDLRATYDARGKKEETEAIDELPEGYTEEQLAAYRKAKGIPESPDLYEFEVPEGKDLTDADVQILDDFAKAMHERNMPADVVRDISGWFLEYEEVVAQQRAETAYNARVETEEKLRAEWGADYRPNVNLMANILQEHLGAAAPEFLSAQMADGTRLGDNESFIRLMADLARKVGGSSAELYTTDVQTTGKGLETRKAELMKMMNDPDPQVRKKYWAADTQEELQRIQTAISRRTG